VSQNSKVSPILRGHILNILKAEGLKVSNAVIEFRTNFSFSLRKIQEATQKMTLEGTLSKTVENGVTYYSLTNAASVNEAASGAAAGTTTSN
jgi:DNA-binding transcriptional regulator PaaX